MSNAVTSTETQPDTPGRIDDVFVQSLIEFISDEVAHDDDTIFEDTDLLLTGQVDSLGVVIVVGWLEQQLDIRIDPLDVVLENFQTVGQMAEYLRRR